MKQSLTYYLTIFVLKLKGIKKTFSVDPIDFTKIRKEDVFHPKGSFFKQNVLQTFSVLNSSIIEISENENYDKLLLFVHGGAFVSGPAQHHWDTVKVIAQQTNCKIWMCNYPKAPESKIEEIATNIAAVYKVALEQCQPNNIVFIGDSVGATLITTLVQRLIHKEEPMPSKIILVSPVMDASMSNPDIEKLDNQDPMLSKVGVLSAKKMCIGKNDLKNSIISPLYGSFENFPPTILFIATHDITYPDQKLAIEKMTKSKVELKVIEGQNMPHIWPFLPVMKEAKIALKEIINEINKNR